MKTLISCLLLATMAVASVAEAKKKKDGDFATEKREEVLNDAQKIAVCQDFADEYFCGSAINAGACLRDHDIERKVEVLKQKRDVIVERKTALKAKVKGVDMKLVRRDNFQVMLNGNSLTSRYSTTIFSKDGKIDPSFVLDRSCRGDGDDD